MSLFSLQSKNEIYISKIKELISRGVLTDFGGEPRQVGAGLEKFINDNFDKIIDKSDLINQKFDLSRKSMGDIEFQDKNNNLYFIDIKTHNLDTKFNMPNLTSVVKLSNLYKIENNYFVIIMIGYKIRKDKIIVQNIIISKIENLTWKSLGFGNLGNGQIQIKNSNKIEIDYNQSRNNWMLELCNLTIEFYHKVINKKEKGIVEFEKLKNYWLTKL